MYDFHIAATQKEVFETFLGNLLLNRFDAKCVANRVHGFSWCPSNQMLEV